MPTTITGTDGVNQVQAGAVEATDLPSEAYQKNNILGTVSESSGVPTGAIIERGSNANGEYVKYADGTLICFAEGIVSPDPNVVWGGLFRTASSGAVIWTFPATFSSSPVITADAHDFNRLAYCRARPNNTSASMGAIADTQNDIGPISIIATGRWY